jgi:ribosomal protein S18 acetylase RimI-like enzyme
MLASETIILKVALNDIESLRNICIQTFTETFAEHNTKSDMQKYTSDNLNIKKLTEEFNTINSEFYFIRFENKVIGYLKLNSSESQTEFHNDNALEIERIYVLKEFHGKHIGKLLLEKAIDIAKEKQRDYIWLGVWENNEKAIAFYNKHGFIKYDKHIFKLGNDEQTDIMMKLILN